MKKKYLWKFLRTGLKSQHGDCVWTVGEWKKLDKLNEISTCHYGFHASEKIIDAFGYVNGEVLAKVEVRGKHQKEDNKQAWSAMRLVKTYHWTKEDSVKLAIFSAEQVIDIYEKKYPKDKRPREAIEAAKARLKNPSKVTADAAARAATQAAREAEASYAANVAYAAYAANAANADAYTASAASYASYAVYAACVATEKVLPKVEKWLLAHVKEMKEITINIKNTDHR